MTALYLSPRVADAVMGRLIEHIGEAHHKPNAVNAAASASLVAPGHAQPAACLGDDALRGDDLIGHGNSSSGRPASARTAHRGSSEH